MKRILLTFGALLIAGSGLMAQNLKQSENLRSEKKINHALTIDPVKPAGQAASNPVDVQMPVPPNKKTPILLLS